MSVYFYNVCATISQKCFIIFCHAIMYVKTRCSEVSLCWNSILFVGLFRRLAVKSFKLNYKITSLKKRRCLELILWNILFVRYILPTPHNSIKNSLLGKYINTADKVFPLRLSCFFLLSAILSMFASAFFTFWCFITKTNLDNQHRLVFSFGLVRIFLQGKMCSSIFGLENRGCIFSKDAKAAVDDRVYIGKRIMEVLNTFNSLYLRSKRIRFRALLGRS